MEQLNDLRKYTNEFGAYVQNTINDRIDEIMDKLNLLENMRYEITYKDFDSSWSSGLNTKLINV